MKIILLMNIFIVLGCAEKFMPPYNPSSPHELCRVLTWMTKQGICKIASMHQRSPGIWSNATVCVNSSSPLHVAVGNDCNPCVRLLLALGADVNARDGQGRTPLHIAVDQFPTSPSRRFGSQHSYILFDLIHAGARVNVQDFSGDTPLHLAVKKDLYASYYHSIDPKLLTSNTLLVAGAERSLENLKGETPVSLAMGEDEGFALFLMEEKVLRMRFPVEFCEEVWRFPETCPFNETESDLDVLGRNTLMRRVIWGENDTLSDEDMEGCDVNARDIFNRTALHEACRLGKTETVKKLLDKKARVNLRDWLGQTPLHLASMCLRDDVKAELQNSRANQNAPDRKGRTPEEITKFVT